MALGGSTNAIIHLIAMAGRAGAALDLDRFDALSRRTPFLANIRPSGKFLMEDFYYAGGLRGLLEQTARSAAHRLPDGERPDARRERRRRDRLQRRRDRAARSAARPRRRCRGAARQPRAAGRGHQAHRRLDRRLLQHAGPAVVFRNYNDLEARIDDPGSAGHARFGAGAAGRRPARRPGHAGVGHAADSEEAAGARASATWCASPTRA